MRKITPCLLLFSMICIYASGQNVTKVTAYFKTTNEAKNDKSKLEIVFKTAGSVLIASYSDPSNPPPPAPAPAPAAAAPPISSGKFDAFSIHTIPLVPGNQPVDNKSLTGCQLAITFLPCDSCNEVWKFDCDLYVDFSDKSTRIFSFRQITLSKKNYFFEKAVAN